MIRWPTTSELKAFAAISLGNDVGVGVGGGGGGGSAGGDSSSGGGGGGGGGGETRSRRRFGLRWLGPRIYI